MSTPVTIITGFLGSGKTTLLNKILRDNHHKRIGILLNEFGDRALETDFIVEDAQGIVEFPGGCLCHAPVGEIVSAVKKILAFENKIEHLVIEASGLTNPLPVMQLLNSDELKGKVHLDSVICLIDTYNFAEQYQKQHILMQGQLLYADFVLLTKTDIVSADQTARVLGSLTSLAPSLHILDLNDLPSTRALLDRDEGPKDVDLEAEAIEDDHVHFHQYLFTATQPVDHNLLFRLVEHLPPEVLRVKGVIYPYREAQKKYFLHKVGSRVDMLPLQRGRDEEPETKVLFVGSELPGNLAKLFEGAIVEPKESVISKLRGKLQRFKTQ